MKSIATLLLFFACINIGFPQSKLTLFSEQDRQSQNAELVINSTIHEFLLETKPTTFDLDLPFKKGIIKLEKFDLFSSTFKVSTDKNQNFYPRGNYTFYKAHTENSIYTFIVIQDQVALFFSDEEGNHEITKSENGKYTHRVSLINLSETDFGCKVIEDERREDSDLNANHRTSTTNECIDIYLEIDHDQYNTTKGSDPALYIQSTTNWAVGLMAQVSIQFNRIGIPLKISGIKIFTSLDPYAIHSTSQATLYAFSDSMYYQGFNGRLAHLLVGRNIGGGVAFLSSLCSNYTNHAVSGNLNSGVVGYPAYSWNVMVVAHELGHNFGSRHTHDCAWNGNNTAIDGCYANNGCANPGIPSNGGTIMSYCHLQSVGTNLGLGFGPQPSALIYDRFQNSTCNLSNDCSGTPPINDLCVTSFHLPNNKSCLIYKGDNFDSTPSNGLSNSSCTNASTYKDVWFTATVGVNGNLVVETKQITNGLSDLDIEIYKGNCDALVYHLCDDNSGDLDHAKIIITDPSMANETLFIRVIEKNNAVGSFGICVTSQDVLCNTMEAMKLSNFYNALNGYNWNNKSGWDQYASGNCDFCSWYGIHCNYLGFVDSIKLSNNNLTDTLLPSLEFPMSMQMLDLSNNQIEGKFPPQWLNLSKLRTFIAENNLINDTLPPIYGKYNLLQKYDVSNNNLNGKLPRFIGYMSNLNYFDASNNNLSGCFEHSLLLMEDDHLNLNNNAYLPLNGNTSLFYADSTGNDQDWDFYCFKINDCNDLNNNVYNGAPELCDLLDNDCDLIIDDGIPTENIFIASNSNWNNNSAWSLGHKPLVCENIIIGNGTSTTISTISTQSYYDVKSLFIHPNSTVDINNNGGLFINGEKLLNNGTLSILGFSSIGSNENFVPDTSLINNGVMTIGTSGNLNINNFQSFGIYNSPSGSITNNGYIGIGDYELPNPLSGFINKGTFNNFGQFYINANTTQEQFKSFINSLFTNKPGAILQLGRQGGAGG